jgi:hypothetical protein
VSVPSVSYSIVFSPKLIHYLFMWGHTRSIILSTVRTKQGCSDWTSCNFEVNLCAAKTQSATTGIPDGNSRTFRSLTCHTCVYPWKAWP